MAVCIQKVSLVKYFPQVSAEWEVAVWEGELWETTQKTPHFGRFVSSAELFWGDSGVI